MLKESTKNQGPVTAILLGIAPGLVLIASVTYTVINMGGNLHHSDNKAKSFALFIFEKIIYGVSAALFLICLILCATAKANLWSPQGVMPTTLWRYALFSAACLVLTLAILAITVFLQKPKPLPEYTE